jgi:hypothetical protein
MHLSALRDHCLTSAAWLFTYHPYNPYGLGHVPVEFLMEPTGALAGRPHGTA